MATQVSRDQVHGGYIDLAKHELRNPVAHQLGADPGTPSNGQWLYRTDTNRFRGRINGAWDDFAMMADVTAAGISSTLVDVKGDLIVATADNTVARLAAGANGTILVANSAAGTGLNWRTLTVADIQASATARLFGRSTAAAGPGEEISVSAALVLSGGVLDRAALTGDITASAGSNATTIGSNKVTNAMLAQAATLTLKGNNTGGTANVSDLTATQVKTLLAITGADVAFTPTGNITSTTVQTAIAELETDYTAAITAATEGKFWKDPVRVATTVTGTLATAYANGQVVDGITLVTGDRILLKNQSTAAENGIYTVNGAGAPTRAADANIATEVNKATVLVLSGTAGIGDTYTQTATVTTLGTDAQTWVKSGEGNTVYTADETSLHLTGTVFSILTGGIDLSSTQIAAAALPATKGGTGQTTFAIGDLLQASSSSVIAKLAAVATGNVLISGGVGTISSWGKVGLTTHVTGVLPEANGGTNATTFVAALATAAGTRKFAGNLTGGAQTEVVTHGLGTRDVHVNVYNQNTPWAEEDFEVAMTSTTTVTVSVGTGATIPGATYRVVVIG